MNNLLNYKKEFYHKGFIKIEKIFKKKEVNH